MYVKLFGTILDSSIWAEDHATRIVWITMLAMAGPDGVVQASVSGLTRRACVSERECRKALKVLEAPDRESKSQEYQGRRIQKVEGGWLLLNYRKYREIRSSNQMMDAIRQQRHRQSRPVTAERDMSRDDRDTSQNGVTNPNVTTEEEVEVEEEEKIQTGGSVSSVMTRNRTLPKRYDEIREHLSAVLAQVQEGTQGRLRADELRDVQAELVFAYWQARLKHETAILDEKRLNRLRARLRENGGNVHELLYVVDGALKDRNLMGENERNRKYDGIETLFRDRGQVERLAELGGWKPEKRHPMADKYLAGAA